MRPKAPKHNRIKQKGKHAPNPKEQFHMDRVSKIPCVHTGEWVTELHHIKQLDRHVLAKEFGFTRKGGRDHRFVVPLRLLSHKVPDGVHGVGLETGFLDKYGIDLVEWAINEWLISERMWDETHS